MVRSDTARSSASARAVVTPRRRSRCTMRKRRSARRTDAAILRLARLEDPDRGAGGIAQDAEDAVRGPDAIAHHLRPEIPRPPGALRPIANPAGGEPSPDSFEQPPREPPLRSSSGLAHRVFAARNAA